MSNRTRTIEKWIDLNQDYVREAWSRLPGVHDGGGLLYMGGGIDATGGNGPLARFIRGRADSRGEPLIRMTLPNPLTARRWRDIYRTAQKKGIQVVVVPQAVVQEADIRRGSIKILHTERRRRMFRPPHQVIQADVAPQWGRQRPRIAYFLSGYDLNERGLSYFFCELPTDEPPESIEHAYQLLKPESVKRAEAQGRKVRRQGDMFFIETRGEEGPPEEDILFNASLFASNHIVSELANHKGLVMVRGKILHRPFGRRPDHAPLRLPGKGWWIAVQNAVRVTAYP
jgi:hypothetical protein